MPRQDVHSLTPATTATPVEGGAPAPPPPTRRRPGAVARLLLLPFAALAAAVCGLVFVLLLPICGIGSIAGAVAEASWGLVREALGGARRRTSTRS